jgi:NADH-quinone oxidoreductase subunit L
MHTPAMLISLTVVLIGIALAFGTYYWKKINADALAQKFSLLYKFLYNKWYIDEIYEAIIVNGTKVFSRIFGWIDSTIVDGVVNGVAKLTVGIAHGVQKTWKLQSLPAILYIIATALLSLYIGWEAMLLFIPDTSSVFVVIEYGILGLAVSALTFFLFYKGVGSFDTTIIDGVVNLVASVSGLLGLVMRRFQTGKVQTYILWVLFGVIIFFLWFS